MYAAPNDSFTQRPIASALSLIAVLALLGCGGESTRLTSQDTALEPCVGIDSVEVEALADLVPAECDLGNISLVFPDGFAARAPLVGQSVASGSAVTPPDLPFTYSMWNIGIDGVIAARTSPRGTTTEWWGSPQGIKRIQDTEGTDIPPISQ